MLLHGSGAAFLPSAVFFFWGIIVIKINELMKNEDDHISIEETLLLPFVSREDKQ